MNSSDIMKSFQYFYEKVLPCAFTSPDFSEEGISKAFMWAEFCDKLHEQLNEDHKRKVQELFGAQTTYQGRGSFKQCTAALCQAFIQNPSLEKNSLKTILSSMNRADFNWTEIWDDTEKFNDLSLNLINSLKPICLKESNVSLYYEVKSELFMDFLKDVSQQLVTGGQADTYFNFLFETMCENEDSMRVLLSVLMWDEPGEAHIRIFATQWVLLKLMDNPEGPLARFLWGQPPAELRIIAAGHPAFCSLYLDILKKKYDSGQNRTKKHEIISFSFDEVVKHFEVLTSCHDDLADAASAHLQRLAEGSAAWRDVLSAVT